MKNKLLVLAITALCFIWFTNATYSLTGDELKNVNSQKITISEASNDILWKYHTQLDKRYNLLKTDERLWTLSKELRDYSMSLLDSRKKLSKQQSAATKSKFLDEYKSDISSSIEFPKEKCTWRYNTIDNISFANNFPTALTIAIRYRESTCSYYLPNNWYWPFQIMSKNYWTWEITEEIFKQSIQDFIDFTKNKIENYNKKSDEQFPKINLSYTWFDYTGVVSVAALYNWWTRTGWMVIPNAPKYVFDWYWKEYSWAKKYGIYPMFLKVLEREINNM